MHQNQIMFVTHKELFEDVTSGTIRGPEIISTICTLLEIRNLVQTRFRGGSQSKAETILRVLVERISGSGRGQSAKEVSKQEEKRGLVSSRADRKKSFNGGSLLMGESLLMGGKSFN